MAAVNPLPSWSDALRHNSLDEIIKEQGIKPLTAADLEAMAGSWPGDIDDGFEEMLYRWREPIPLEQLTPREINVFDDDGEGN